MTAAEVIRQIEALPKKEQTKLRDWMRVRAFEESPEMLEALDAAVRSADEHGTVSVQEARLGLARWTIRSA